MAKVDTVRGPVDSDSLGVTLMHEHVFLLSPEFGQNYPEFWGDEETRIQRAITQLRDLRAAGVDTILDLTVLGAGRSIPRIQRVASRTDLNILVATGLYTIHDLPVYLQSRNPVGSYDVCEFLAKLFVRDIREGIADTGVKAAVLKCATDRQGVTWGVEQTLRAVARAQRETGVPITTHTHAGSKQGNAQQKIFEEEGVDLSRVVIGHCGDTTDCDYLERLIEKGSYIGMDRFGIDSILSFESRVDTVVRMCKRGFASNMVLSHDAACYIDWLEEEPLRSALPNWHFRHIAEDVVPELRRRGVTDLQIQSMLVENPRRIFGRA
jgi:phosphotriesterase-related protein